MAEELVMVARFRDLPEALFAKGKLESAGIECFLTDQNMVRLDWFYSNVIGGMRLLVRQEDEAAAKQVLAEPPPDFTEEEVGEAYKQPHCPKCDSLDISYTSLNRGVSYTLMYLNVPFPVPKRHWHCNACGAEWVWEGPGEYDNQPQGQK
jgi:putative signal transducing protein